MNFDIRLPQINASTEKEQLAQIKSYLYQFTEKIQLEFEQIYKSLKDLNEQLNLIKEKLGGI